MENMTTDCGSPAGTGYIVRHNPYAYYGDIVTNATRCARVVPAGIDDRALLDDLGSASNASNYMWLTPNLCNDMDVCPVAAGDAYLSNLVPKILGSPVFTTKRAALFITFDEAANGRGTPAIYTVWSGPAGSGVNHVTIQIQVIGRLSAQIGSPSSTFTGQSVDFLGSALGGQSPYNYSWQLGDQSTMTGDRVSHVYSSEGVYRVNLTIDDGSGQVALASKDLTVARSTPGVLTEAATGVEDVRATL